MIVCGKVQFVKKHPLSSTLLTKPKFYFEESDFVCF